MGHTACTELQCVYKGALCLPLPCLWMLNLPRALLHMTRWGRNRRILIFLFAYEIWMFAKHVSTLTTVLLRNLKVPHQINISPQNFCNYSPQQPVTCSYPDQQVLQTYLLTYSMEQSPWEANHFSASHDIPRISWKPKVHYRVYESPPPVSILSHIKTVHAPLPTS